jgi:DNA-binding CsgD family transcriptional regulator
MDLNSVVGDIYDAGAGLQDWKAVGRRLYNLFGAQAGSLRVDDPCGESVNLFEPDATIESAYTDHFAHVDPIRPATRTLPLGGDWQSLVVTQDDLVPDEIYHRSEFFNDFACPNGQRHMLIGALGGRDHRVVSFFRDDRFGPDERSALASLLPHFQRAIQLRQRFLETEIKARAAQSAFEALPNSALIVDADLNVVFANGAAGRLLSRRGYPVSMSASSAHGTRLGISNRDKAARLRSLVHDAAQGGSGGAMRIELDTGTDDRIDQLAVLVSPQPPEMALAGMNHVLVLITELSRPSAPKPSLLSDLFGLSIAEGAVALALLGGQTAETVARDRDVSLDTVRSQIRTVLRKTDAANLRDFERIGALLTTLAH